MLYGRNKISMKFPIKNDDKYKEEKI